MRIARSVIVEAVREWSLEQFGRDWVEHDALFNWADICEELGIPILGHWCVKEDQEPIPEELLQQLEGRIAGPAMPVTYQGMKCLVVTLGWEDAKVGDRIPDNCVLALSSLVIVSADSIDLEA